MFTYRFRQEGRMKRSVFHVPWDVLNRYNKSDVTMILAMRISDHVDLSDMLQTWPGPVSVAWDVTEGGLHLAKDLLKIYPTWAKRINLVFSFVPRQGVSTICVGWGEGGYVYNVNEIIFK